MSLRIIYGKSGTGKTTFCFNQIKKLIDNNKKVFIITPEQFSFSAEKRLMETCERKAVFNAEVISFERMAHRIINEVGGINKNTISTCGKAMALASIIENQKGNLNFLGKNNKNLDVIIRMLTELKKNNISCESLNNKIKEIDNKYLKLKLDDINILYNNFNNFINEKYLDTEDLLTLVVDKIKESLFIKDSYIYIDEFAGFTKQEYKVIEELLKNCKEVSITMCTDTIEESKEETDIFAPNKKTLRKILNIVDENKIERLPDINLDKVYRYKNDEIYFLADNLYNINNVKYTQELENIELFLANNNYSEIEYIANNIVELVRDKKYRYRDISIITKNIEEYSSLIKSIFAKYNIPVFIDEKKDLNQNILVKYIISILEVFSRSWCLDSVISYVKNGFISGISNYDIYIFENYCKKCGISGYKKFNNVWEIETNSHENLEYLNKIREKIVNPLNILKSELSKNKTVLDISKSLYNFLINNEVEKILSYKINQFMEDGNIELANIYNSSWDIIINIIDEIVLILGEEKISFENYVNILKTGFNNSSLGKIPATLDEVIVGDVDRSRSSKKQIVFIIGLNDGKFPSINKNEGFINDEERIYLKENGLELAKTTKEQIYDENFNIYKAFGITENKLYLSYSASDIEGKGLRKSILINKIKKILPKLIEKSDIIQNNIVIGSKETTFDILLLNIRKFLNGDEIEKKWFELYKIYSQDSEYKEKLDKSIQGFYYTNLPEDINKENLEKLYGNTLVTSISKLESYRKCPFSYYLRYGLKLSDRIELKMERLDTGTLMHDIIDSFFEEVNNSNLDLKKITEQEVNNILENIINEKLSLKQNYVFNSTPKYIVLTNRLKKVIIQAIKYIINSLKQSEFKVFGTEIEFGEGKQYSPIEIQVDENKKVKIIGKIDRIDIAENENGKYIRIIDYKSSIKNIDLNEVIYGIQIQLLTYLDAVCKNEETESAGMLYFNLIEPVIKAKNKNMTEEQIEQEIRNNFKMNGLILGNINVVKMMDTSLQSGQSHIIPAYIDKEGNISKGKSSTLEREEFKILQNQVEKIIKEISKEILNGKISQNPVYMQKKKKSACDFCSYKTICCFDTKMCNNNYNFVPYLDKNEILNNLKSEE